MEEFEKYSSLNFEPFTSLDNMGKRGADKELTQNNWQENEDESNSEVRLVPSLSIKSSSPLMFGSLFQGGSGEFKKASGSQLEGRKYVQSLEPLGR